MLKSVRYAPFLQWSVQLQIVLSIRSLCSLPTTVCAAADSIVMLPFYNSKTTVSLQIVRQVAVLPFFTGNLHCCKSGHSAPFLQQWGHRQLALLTACSNFIPIYPTLFEFILNLSEFYRVFEWKEGSCDKVAWSVLSQQTSSHTWRSIYTGKIYYFYMYIRTHCHTSWHYATPQTTPKHLPQQPASDLGSDSIADCLLMLTYYSTGSYIK